MSYSLARSPLRLPGSADIYIYTYIIYIIDFTCHGFPWMSLQFHQYWCHFINAEATCCKEMYAIAQGEAFVFRRAQRWSQVQRFSWIPLLTLDIPMCVFFGPHGTWENDQPHQPLSTHHSSMVWYVCHCLPIFMALSGREGWTTHQQFIGRLCLWWNGCLGPHQWAIRDHQGLEPLKLRREKSKLLSFDRQNACATCSTWTPMRPGDLETHCGHQWIHFFTDNSDSLHLPLVNGCWTDHWAKDLETILEDFPQDKVSRPQGRARYIDFPYLLCFYQGYDVLVSAR